MSHMFISMFVFASVFAGCSQEEIGDLDKEALMNPKSEAMNQQAPDEYTTLFETSAGNFTIEVTRSLAPRGADRFYNLVMNGFYDDQRFFRAVENFMVQFGIPGDPEVTAQWHNARILDDPVNASNVRGTICFAKANLPNTRTTQVFISYKDNSYLDKSGFAPFGKVIEGMEVVDSLYKGYGEAPQQQSQQIATQGNAFLEKRFPELDYIVKARIVD